MDVLSTSGINQNIEAFKYYEKTKKINPLQVKKDKYANLSSTWGGLKSKLSSLQTLLSDLKSTSTSNSFSNKTATLSKSDFFSVAPESTASASSYNIRVNQLARGDLILSESKTSTGVAGATAGKHKMSMQSGDYTGYVEFDVTGSETYSELMDKVSNAIKNDKAVIKSTDPGGGNITKTGKLTFDVNGSTKEIEYSYDNKAYSEVVTDLIQKINGSVSGVTAEVINGNLQITVNNSSNYISISDSTGNLGSSLGINVTKEKGLSGLANSSVFTPSTGKSKFSIEAKESGYDNRLILSDVAGNSLNQLGLTSTLLTNRTLIAGDDAAGFKYTANSVTDNQLNAKLSFNGINVSRNSNTIKDLITGVTFSLKAEMGVTDADVSVNVANDTKTSKSKIESFISKFNEAYLQIKNNYTSTKTNRGIFTGDPVASGLMNELKNLATGSISGIDSEKINQLSEIGITFDPTNGLSISSSTTLDSVLNEKISEVASLFNSDDGIATRLYNKLETLTSSTGSISSMMNSFDNNTTFYSDKIKSTNERIEKSAEVLRKKYEKLQVQYANMLSLSSNFSSDGGYF